jgi:hypothetical protein
VTLIDAARRKASRLIVRIRDRKASHDTRSHNTREADVVSDPDVANSRAGMHGEDGRYVGRTFPDVPFDVGQSGAEARSEQKRKGTPRHPEGHPGERTS